MKKGWEKPSKPSAEVQAPQKYRPQDKESLSKEFFMPRSGGTFDENNVPPWRRGDFRV
jgi:hypothetical protein